jgi:predicted alpha/beta superfamily hydrolase
MQATFHGEPGANFCLVQPVGEHDEQTIPREMELIRQITNQPFAFVAVKIDDWNKELSPWEAPAVFGNENFGNGAEQTLPVILNEVLPKAKEELRLVEDTRFILGGYSLAGLFALWAATRSDMFSGVAAVSPSVWFPGWDVFCKASRTKAQKVFLSLGDKESRTKNEIMAQVAERIQLQSDVICEQLGGENCTLHWEKGGHFKEPEARTARGFAWVLNCLTAPPPPC